MLNKRMFQMTEVMVELLLEREYFSTNSLVD
jgi:hypothetical protein